MVTTMSQNSVSRSIIQGRCCDTGTLLRQLGTMEEAEDIMVFLRNPVGGVKVSRTRKEANSGSPNYL